MTLKIIQLSQGNTYQNVKLNSLFRTFFPEVYMINCDFIVFSLIIKNVLGSLFFGCSLLLNFFLYFKFNLL